MNLLFQRSQSGLIPACDEATAWLKKKKLGVTILVEPREMRNGALFKKYWALLNVGFDYWSENAETLEYKGQPVRPEFDRFRKDVIISAGFYHAVVNIKGEIRIEHESLQWSSMSEERFEQLYSATIDVLLKRVFNGKICQKMTAEELRNLVQQIMEFA